VIVALAVIVGALGWVAAKGLSSSLVYYNTPTELTNKGQAAVGERFRVGGLVESGSIRTAAGVTRFVITDETTRLSVVDRGDLPELFRAGQGVVVEGYLGRDGAFHADDVLIKHNGVYEPPRPGTTPHTADVG